MFTGPQHTLTLRSNLRSPQTMPTEADTCRKWAVPKLQGEVDALKRLQAETAVNNMGQAAAELNAFPPSPRLRRTGLPAILDKDIRTGIDSTS